SLTRGIGELLRLLDPGLSDLVRTPQVSFLFGTAIFVYGLFHWRNHITHSVSLMQKSPAQATPTVSQRCEKTT
ncbi:hypothetical protein ACK3Y2_20730, partial [Aeromonas caviae]